GYTADTYRRAVAAIREVVPSLAVTTDVIVGFPTETEEDFEQTRAFMDEIGFDNAFVFKYSPRSGTAAEEWEDDVPDEEKLRRNRVLLADQDERAARANAGLQGSIVSVLAEGASARNPATWSGRTVTNKIVIFEPPEGGRAGDLLNLRVNRTTAQSLYGEACEG
ncbi:MAG: TRAM domain-containing protein, partial [Lentisphaerae bacterium]|nr:TRAM domain-containing protein [Lentisphaerota bacterium]